MSPVGRIVEILENARQRKEMYFSPVDGKTVNDTLIGFKLGCFACGVQIPHLIRERVVTEHGWTMNSMGIESQCREQGLSESQIADELLAIELEGWQRLAELEKQA